MHLSNSRMRYAPRAHLAKDKNFFVSKDSSSSEGTDGSGKSREVVALSGSLETRTSFRRAGRRDNRKPTSSAAITQGKGVFCTDAFILCRTSYSSFSSPT